jgi:threonine/homoserine/homoserine lactone efflux protein
MTLAHAGHWITSVLYVAPVALVVGWLSWQAWRERGRSSDETPEGPATD